ncbi:hypothetical protein FRC02_002032 [Tulasnella sp. 418]|nr:hypothetical protein FRC02_002032 [Tulasnella sp. 418]
MSYISLCDNAMFQYLPIPGSARALPRRALSGLRQNEREKPEHTTTIPSTNKRVTEAATESSIQPRKATSVALARLEEIRCHVSLTSPGSLIELDVKIGAKVVRLHLFLTESCHT